MGSSTPIEWTEATWNPVTGCTKISPGCQHCYAERLARRLQGMGNRRYANGFQVTLHDDLVGLPLRWLQPRMVFVNSMGDLFHDDVPEEFVQRAFETMRQAHWHTFQILTKRSSRLAELAPRLGWAPNIWMGVTVESAEYAARLDALRTVDARVRFVSLEPLLGPVHELDLTGLHWVIVGGESGPGARPMRREWVEDVRELCWKAGVHFFFKQWGGPRKKAAGRQLDGRTWDEMPALTSSRSPRLVAV